MVSTMEIEIVVVLQYRWPKAEKIDPKTEQKEMPKAKAKTKAQT
jgi:hypothetical protein